LACLFAKEGNLDAKRAIIKRFNMKAIQDSPWLGYEEILELEGLKGLLLIAKRRGKSLLNHPGDWEDSFYIDHFQEAHPEINVYEELMKASNESLFIKRYIEVIQERRNISPKHVEAQKSPYQTIIDNIKRKQIVPASPRLIKSLSKGDLKKLAKNFIIEKDPVKQEKNLRIFSTVKFPLSYSHILRIASGPNPKNTRLVEFACSSLKFFKATHVRKVAIDRLSKRSVPGAYLQLLISNYKSGDHKLIETFLARFKNQDIIHSTVRDIVEIFKKNPTKDCKKSLEFLYDTLTCSIHRYDVVEILHKNGCLSKKIEQELIFDCHEALRGFLKNKQAIKCSLG